LLIVDRDARIHRANRAAEVLLSGENLISVGGRLSAAASSPTRRLHGLIAAAASPESRTRTGGSMALPTQARLPLSIVVVPFSVERLGPFHLSPHSPDEDRRCMSV